jgi:hypothetical protein
VRHRSREPELPADQAGPAAGVGDEARFHGAHAVRTLDVDNVAPGAPLIEGDTPDLAAVEHLDAGGHELVEQRVLEPAAIQLE